MIKTVDTHASSYSYIVLVVVHCALLRLEVDRYCLQKVHIIVIDIDGSTKKVTI